MLYYLNPTWTATAGGELRIWDRTNVSRDLAPRNDRLVVFASSLEHEVLGTRVDRLAVTTWFYNRLELALELVAEKKAARKDEFECELGCGFRGGFDEVARHEETCVFVGDG